MGPAQWHGKLRSSGDFDSLIFNGHHKPAFCWRCSTHVSGTALMNGGISPLTNSFQFAGARGIDHELSFRMQTHEATFMQGQPDETSAWDGTRLANPAAPRDGHGSEALYVPNPVLQSPAVITCNCPTWNRTTKRDPDRSRHEHSVHFKTPGLHLCPIVGCPKSYGKGYSCPDKMTEHLWKNRANLGFTNA